MDWNIFLETFLAFFVAIDAVGCIPIFSGLTYGLSAHTKRKIIVQAMVTAAIVATGFVLIGTWFLNKLGITMGDFRIAGGILLFLMAIRSMLASGEEDKPAPVGDHESLGAVPFGVPFIAGPALLAILVTRVDRFGPAVAGTAMVLNILLTGFIFLMSDRILHLMGKAGSKTFSKLSSLVLAAFAVMLVRQGLEEFIQAMMGK